MCNLCGNVNNPPCLPEPPHSFPQKDSMSSSSLGSSFSSMPAGGAPAAAPASGGSGYTSSSQESFVTTHHPALSTVTGLTKKVAAATAEKEAADLIEYPQTSSTVSTKSIISINNFLLPDLDAYLIIGVYFRIQHKNNENFIDNLQINENKTWGKTYFEADLNFFKNT